MNQLEVHAMKTLQNGVVIVDYDTANGAARVITDHISSFYIEKGLHSVVGNSWYPRSCRKKTIRVFEQPDVGNRNVFDSDGNVEELDTSPVRVSLHGYLNLVYGGRQQAGKGLYTPRGDFAETVSLNTEEVFFLYFNLFKKNLQQHERDEFLRWMQLGVHAVAH